MTTEQPATGTIYSNRFTSLLQKKANKFPRTAIISSSEETAEHNIAASSADSKDTKESMNLNKASSNISEMGYELLRKKYQQMCADLRTMEGQSGETSPKSELVERLFHELQDGKEANIAMRKQIEAYQGVLKSKRLALDALSSRLEEIKSENERAVASLRSGRDNPKTGDSDSTLTASSLKREVDLGKHNEVVAHLLCRLESTVLKLQTCNHGNSPQDL